MDYVRTAHAKGLTNRTVLFKHALRNAILPFVTIIGLDIPFLLGGALVTESIFAWPGMGRLFWEYAERGDYPVCWVFYWSLHRGGILYDYRRYDLHGC